MKKVHVILASKSPRRAAILKQVGIDFSVFESKFIEKKPRKKETLGRVRKLVIENATGKAASVSQDTDGIIVGVDTLVWCEGKVLSKPKDKKDALWMLQFLNRKPHYVFSGIAIVIKNNSTEQIVNGCDTAKAYMRNLSKEEIKNYVATGEPMDKAGGYGIQEKGASLIEKVEGDYYTVVGFPLSLFLDLCKNLHLQVL